jgi:hypothetical protein
MSARRNSASHLYTRRGQQVPDRVGVGGDLYIYLGSRTDAVDVRGTGLIGPWGWDVAGSGSDILGVRLRPFSPAVANHKIKVAEVGEHDAKAIVRDNPRSKEARTPFLSGVLHDGRCPAEEPTVCTTAPY